MEKNIYFFLFIAMTMIENLGLAQILNKEQYTPMRLQQYTPPKDTSYKENYLETFDMIGNKFNTIKLKDYNDQNHNDQIQSVLPSNNTQPNEFLKNGEQPYNFNNLTPADQLSGYPAYPITTIVKLYLTFFNPANGSYNYSSCSGAMINPGFIITAGHCVKSNTDQSYAVACTVLPEYNMGNHPFGQTTTTNWYSFTQWTNNGNWDYDMAILSLASPMGNSTGWLGFGYNSNNNFFTSSSNIFHSFGYPAQNDFGQPVLEQGERMYYMNGYMDFWSSANVMCHYNIGYHGQSGSALYYNDVSSNNRIVYGVLSHGNGATAPYYTCHCRMDGNMFNYFKSVIPLLDGIKTNKATKQISMYPNPANTVFNIDVNEITYKNLTVNVFNGEGDLVFKKSFSQESLKVLEVDLTDLSAGIYFVNLKIDDYSVNGKICKVE